MRAFVVTAPGQCSVQDVEPPAGGPGEVVVDVARVGVCGTDVEFFTGEMAYLHDGHAAYPMRLGHEWCGVVSAVGPGVEASWRGRRVVGDTMLGCGRCRRCQSGRQHTCDDRTEVGIRGGRAGALAEQLAVPASSLVALPDVVDDAAGAMVEPGANALRAVLAADLKPAAAPGLRRGDRRLHRAAAARDGPRAGRAGQACRLHRDLRHAQHRRHPHHAAQGRHRGGSAVGLTGAGAGGAGVRRGVGRSPGAGPGPKMHVDPQLIKDKDMA
jgi:hypothetical protein